MVRFCEVNLDKWLSGFNTVEESVRKSVQILNAHPLIPDDVTIRGYIIDTDTGKLDLVKE